MQPYSFSLRHTLSSYFLPFFMVRSNDISSAVKYIKEWKIFRPFETKIVNQTEMDLVLYVVSAGNIISFYI